MDKVRYYQILDGIKLCVDSSVSILNVPSPAEPNAEHDLNVRTARKTIQIANRKLREMMESNWNNNDEEV